VLESTVAVAAMVVVRVVAVAIMAVKGVETSQELRRSRDSDSVGQDRELCRHKRMQWERHDAAEI
jgi:hypothetical protein